MPRLRRISPVATRFPQLACTTTTLLAQVFEQFNKALLVPLAREPGCEAGQHVHVTNISRLLAHRRNCTQDVTALLAPIELQSLQGSLNASCICTKIVHLVLGRPFRHLPHQLPQFHEGFFQFLRIKRHASLIIGTTWLMITSL